MLLVSTMKEVTNATVNLATTATDKLVPSVTVTIDRVLRMQFVYHLQAKSVTAKKDSSITWISVKISTNAREIMTVARIQLVPTQKAATLVRVSRVTSVMAKYVKKAVAQRRCVL